ncbi:MAG: hypothetical protein JWQ14_3532 [Adhaeribacter sp.]|nr:hypothetical protein [Adhaeribacter sp.]
MEELGEELFGTKFLDSWHAHYAKLEAYLQQNSFNKLLETGDAGDGLLKWIEIQGRLKNKLPLALRNKLTELNVDFYLQADFWGQRYGQLVLFYQQHGHAHLPAADEKYEALNAWLFRQLQGKKYLSESQFSRLDALAVDWDIITSRDQRWEQMYGRLKEFKETFDHCQVPQNWEPDKSLANWVRVQRRLHATAKLNPKRANRLHALNFIWHVQTIYDAQWQHYFGVLQAFYQAHGHCRVPGKQKQLTSWIENQRTAKRTNTMLPARNKQLTEIGFNWSSKGIKINNWEKSYKLLIAYKRANGHCFVPVKYKENKSLGYWVASQRRMEAQGQLTEVKKKKLSQLGFVWNNHTQEQLQSIYDSQWTLNFEQLKIYQQEYGNCQVSLKINPKLQRWTKWQRMLFCEGRLSAERLARLNEIRFPWNIQEGYWMKMYEALTDFRSAFGHTRVPHKWVPNRQLVVWVYRQKLKRSELTAQKVELLNMIDFDWELQRRKVASWNNMYECLIKFKEAFGHTRVPVKGAEDQKLGKWVSRMRYEKEKLFPERKALLEKIEFDWGYQLV